MVSSKDHPQSPPQTCVVLFDGSCSMCTALTSKIDHSSQKQKFQKINVTTASQLPQGMTRKQAMQEVRVIDSAGKMHANADAILTILEQYPRWKWLATMGRWPIIHPLLRGLYRIIAHYRHLAYGPLGRFFWVKIIVCLGFLAALLLTFRSWSGMRVFPFVPLVAGAQIAKPMQTLLFVGLLTSLLVVLVARRPRRSIFVAAILAALLAILDQNRLQPWAYQYVVMLLALGIFKWNPKNYAQNQITLAICQIIVVAIYFYSGLHKLNDNFFETVFPWMVSPFTDLLPPAWQSIGTLFGLFIPFVEMALGIGLLINKFRKFAVVGLVGMHLSILLCIGPLGHSWNSSVWPWNLAMPALVVVLFWNVKKLSITKLFAPASGWLAKIVLLLFVMMPAFSLANLWDSYLSSSLYSGSVSTATMYVDDRLATQLPPEIRSQLKTTRRGTQLDPQAWAMSEMNNPPYPEPRVFKSVAKSVCAYGKMGGDLRLTVTDKRSWVRRQPVRQYSCADL